MPRPTTVYKKMKVASLAPADYNPRDIDDDGLEGLTASLDEFGMVQPVVWNKKTKTVVGGHQRLKVLRAEGAKEVMVCIVDLSLKREKALNVALNNPHIQGHFTDGLQELLEEIKQDDRHLFRDVALDQLLADEAGRALRESDIVPDVPKDPVTQVGDLWLLGDHRLVCGSSVEHSDVTRLQGEVEGAQCLWTDPPYGIDYAKRPGEGESKEALKARSKKAGGKLAGDKKVDLPKLLKGAFKLAFDYVMRPGSGVYVAHASGDIRWMFNVALREAGFVPRQELVWVKSSWVMGRLDYHYGHEPIWYGFKPGDKTFGRPVGKSAEKIAGRVGWFGDNVQGTVFEVPKPRNNDKHPTMKPVELIAPMVANSSRVGDWVFDPFVGSGSTLVTCQGMDRRCLAMEIDPGYCDVVIERWQNLTGQKAKLG